MKWVINPGGSLQGEITVPGDKSVTQRAYIFAALARGTSRVIAPLRADNPRARSTVVCRSMIDRRHADYSEQQCRHRHFAFALGLRAINGLRFNPS